MMYDDFSLDYDRFINWNNRLGFELPFIEQQLQAAGVRSVLDAATGTGMHAIALAQRGYQVAGADLSPGMIAVARQNAQRAGVSVEFLEAGFGELAAAFGIEPKLGYAHNLEDRADLHPPATSIPAISNPNSPTGRPSFDAVLCLGNSLPHLLTPADLGKALDDFADCLNPGGLLIIQNRNFDVVLHNHQRWMEPQTHQEGAQEWIFLRFYDFRPDGLIDFNILTWQRSAGGAWQQRVSVTQLYPQRQEGLILALQAARFSQIASYGGLNGAPFEPLKSGNLVLVAQLGQQAT